MTDRVPPDVLRTIQEDETTPCGPHCHQGALIEGLRDSLLNLSAGAERRHADVLAALSSLTGTVQGLETVTMGLQAQVTSIAIAAANTANLAGQTASHVAMTPEDAARVAPAPESLPPPATRKRREWVKLAAAGIGTLLGATLGEYVLRTFK